VTRILVLADDLTGAADCAAAFLGRAREVRVRLDGRVPARDAVAVVDLDTRSRPERAARAAVKRAFASRAAKRASLLYKKIDSTLKGHVAAELAALRPHLGRRPLVFVPAFPAQARVVRDARLLVRDRPVAGDLRALLAKAGFPVAQVASPSPAALRAALAIGARAFVCDASTDADLDRVARAGLALRPRPLFVGSAGLARALARTLPRRRPAARPAVARRPVITVVGSASPVSATQARRLSRDRAGVLVQLAWSRRPEARDIPAVRRLGRVVAQAAPKAHYVLTGGETARAVLGALGIRDYRLLGEVEPGVPFGMARDGTLICTKAGAFGGPGTLARCVARLRREMKGP
jgi:4-hydroxythreonine-4-phosphate dehydrogenase